MSVAVAVTDVDTTQNKHIVFGTLTLSSNYGAVSPAHGDVINLALDAVRSGRVPTWVDIEEFPTAGNAPTGYIFKYAPGTTAANGKLQVLQPQGTLNPAIEITQGSAYPSALTAGTANIKFRAEFPSFL